MSGRRESPWDRDAEAALLTDLYELSMLQAYWREGMDETAVFSLFARRMPENRNFLLAAGLEQVLGYLQNLRFGDEAIAYLDSLGRFSGEFLEWLRGFRFSGDVYALPEGTPFFSGEPILEVAAPLTQAQLVETFLLNQVHLQTLLASKAARVVHAARGRQVVDFGTRRAHGADAAVTGARAFAIGGVQATSNVLAGFLYNLPVAGTMAHSYIQAHDDERAAFRDFAALYPDTILLVDTYDTLEAVRKVIKLKQELGNDFRVAAIRLDSGDLLQLSLEARRVLDAAGLDEVRIFASGGLSETLIDGLLEQGAPIDGFGVGSDLAVSADAPSLDLVYKLTEYAGRGRIKRSPGKEILPGRKQVFRLEKGGRAVSDTLGCWGEAAAGRPLLEKVFEAGKRLPESQRTLEQIRAHAQALMTALPPAIRDLQPAAVPYPVHLSAKLHRIRRELFRA